MTNESITGRGAYGEFRSVRQFGSIDGLRAVSILAVLWHHGPGALSSTPVLTKGFLGVHLFFTISGFLITTLLLREREATGSISLGRFWARRSLRIFPLYYLVLALYVALALWTRATPAAQRFLAHAHWYPIYMVNWFVPSGTMFDIAWSLSTEEQFYLVWPWVEKLLPGSAPVYVMLAVLALVQVFPVHGSLFKGSLAGIVIGSIATPICYGVLLAHLLHSRRGYNVATILVGARWSSLFALALTMALLQWPLGFPLEPAAFALLLASCVVREEHWLNWLLGNPVMKHVGLVSYGVYLIHGLVSGFVNAGLGVRSNSVTGFLLCAMISVAVATLSFHTYERFFRNQKKRFETNRYGSFGASQADRVDAAWQR